jgi:hypothetical protein
MNLFIGSKCNDTVSKCNYTVSNSDYTESNDWTTEMSTAKHVEGGAPCLQLLAPHLSTDTDKNHRKTEWGLSVCLSRFEPGVSRAR